MSETIMSSVLYDALELINPPKSVVDFEKIVSSRSEDYVMKKYFMDNYATLACITAKSRGLMGLKPESIVEMIKEYRPCTDGDAHIYAYQYGAGYLFYLLKDYITDDTDIDQILKITNDTNIVLLPYVYERVNDENKQKILTKLISGYNNHDEYGKELIYDAIKVINPDRKQCYIHGFLPDDYEEFYAEFDPLEFGMIIHECTSLETIKHFATNYCRLTVLQVKKLCHKFNDITDIIENPAMINHKEYLIRNENFICKLKDYNLTALDICMYCIDNQLYNVVEKFHNMFSEEYDIHIINSLIGQFNDYENVSHEFLEQYSNCVIKYIKNFNNNLDEISEPFRQLKGKNVNIKPFLTRIAKSLPNDYLDEFVELIESHFTGIDIKNEISANNIEFKKLKIFHIDEILDKATDEEDDEEDQN